MGDWLPNQENADRQRNRRRNVHRPHANFNNYMPNQHNYNGNAMQNHHISYWQLLYYFWVHDYVNWLVNNPTTQPGTSNTQSQIPLCRDYMRGHCMRRNCKYIHRLNRIQDEACHYFQNPRVLSQGPPPPPPPPPPPAGCHYFN